MIIAALNEGPRDARVAITPHVVKDYITLGFEVICETNAGEAAGFSDKEYLHAGAKIYLHRKEVVAQAKVLVCINEPTSSALHGLSPQSLVIGHIDDHPQGQLMTWANANQISLFSMNLIPRISRAQNLDSLSSQANLAGYKAVLEGVAHFKRVIPMMMTAAGMIHPAKILVLGAGVAGLQAIATAKRLGGVIYAFDVRHAAKEQVESLGAEFIEVDQPHNDTNNVYAQEMSEEYKALQADLIDNYAKIADIILCTALIPGKKAPVLLTAATVEQMKPGSVIVDLATGRGGNCALSVNDKIIHHHQITIIGYSNLAGLVPTTASELYANNLLHLLRLLTPTSGVLTFNPKDEIIQKALLCHEGEYFPFLKEQEDASHQ